MIMSTKLCRLIAAIVLLVSSSSAVAAADEDGDVITSLDDAVHKDDNEHKSSHAQDIVDDATLSSATSNGDETSRHAEKMTDNININNNESTEITPPSHFYISAHIQTNLHTGLSYFLPLNNNHNDDDNNEISSSSSYAHIPFLECGAIGSTTAEVPLVSGMLRHVPLMKSSNNNEKRRSELEFLEEKVGVSIISSEEDDDNDNDNGSDTSSFFHDTTNDEDDDEEEEEKEKKQRNLFSGRMKRPSPPTYVVALSPLQITVGGNGNQTQQFDAGDVIFFEDTWLGIQEETEKSPKKKKMDSHQSDDKVKGYIMKAIPESMTDMNVIMLTIPPALHRQWKHKHQRQQQQQKQFLQEKQQESKSSTTLHQEFLSQDKSRNHNDHITSSKAPWWKLSSRIINNKQQHDNVLPKPCSLESDPAFAHPSVSVPTTLSQHFSQHFIKLLRQFQQNNPFQSSLYDADNYDLMFPIVVQTAAATIGAVTAFGGVLHLLRTVNPTVAVGFGAVCLIGFGTWGIVWLGEELLDEWEMWRERRRLEKRMSESWE